MALVNVCENRMKTAERCCLCSRPSVFMVVTGAIDEK